jgi:hypothetical protein
MERELTVRQRRFAAGVASGLSKFQAHFQAYPNNMKRSTREVAAKKLAKRTGVKAEIQRLTLELLPKVEDMRAAYEHAFSTIVRLTIESPDDRLRFDAARWLRAECEKQEQLTYKAGSRLTVQAVPESTESVLEALRKLYEKAGITRGVGSPLMLEVDAEVASPETNGPSINALREFAEAPVLEQDASSERPVGEGEASPNAPEGPMFSRVSIPGRFPPQFRKVRIR